MSSTPFQVALWIELLAAGLGGLQGVMGLFGAIGASKALSLGVGEAGALVIGAIGGGMLRDVIMNLPISFLQVGTLYAVAARGRSRHVRPARRVRHTDPDSGSGLRGRDHGRALGRRSLRWTFPEQRAVGSRTR